MEVIQKVRDRAQELFNQGYETDIGGYIRKGFEIFEKDIGNFIGYTVLFAIICVVSSFTIIGPLLVSGPLTAGFFIVARKIRKGETYEFGTFFKGFDYFVPLLLYSLIGGILTSLGFIALIIPGIYLAVAWMFSILFIVFGDMEF